MKYIKILFLLFCIFFTSKYVFSLSQDSLKGLSAVAVNIDHHFVTPSPKGEIEKFLYEKWGEDVLEFLIPPKEAIFNVDKLKTIVELKLRREGIKILEKNEDMSNFTFSPTLNITIIVFGHFYSLSIAVIEEAYLKRASSTPIIGVTWLRDGILGIYTNADLITSKISEILDEFLNDWYKANPKK